MTHHAPLFNNPSTECYTCNPKYTNSVNQYAFNNDLSHIIKSPLVAWLYGHTHYTGKFKYNDVIIATNQLGYDNEETNFNPYAYLNFNELVMDSL